MTKLTGFKFKPIQYYLKRQFMQKWNFCHQLFTRMQFQLVFLLHNTKKIYILPISKFHFIVKNIFSKYIMFNKRKKVIWVWNNTTVNSLWQNVIFWVNRYLFNKNVNPEESSTHQWIITVWIVLVLHLTITWKHDKLVSL